MTTSGYVSVPFDLNVAMDSVIHDNYIVELKTPNQFLQFIVAGLQVDSVTLGFGSLNWSTPQLVNIVGVRTGNYHLKARIYTNYWQRLGVPRIKKDEILISIFTPELDNFIGTRPGVMYGAFGDQRADCQLSATHVSAGGGENVQITVTGGADNDNLGCQITGPVTTFVYNTGGTVSHACLIAGTYTFQFFTRQHVGMNNEVTTTLPTQHWELKVNGVSKHTFTNKQRGIIITRQTPQQPKVNVGQIFTHEIGKQVDMEALYGTMVFVSWNNAGYPNPPTDGMHGPGYPNFSGSVSWAGTVGSVSGKWMDDVPPYFREIRLNLKLVTGLQPDEGYQVLLSPNTFF